MARRLSDLELEEVSLVDLPAVKRKFLIVKKQNKEVGMEEELTLEEVESEEAESEVEKKLSDKAVNAIKGALKILKPYVKEFPKNVSDAVGALAKAVGYGKPEGYEYAEPKKEETQKAGRKLSKETKDALQDIVKRILSLIEEEVEEATEVKKGVDPEEIVKYVQDKVKELLKS